MSVPTSYPVSSICTLCEHIYSVLSVYCFIWNSVFSFSATVVTAALFCSWSKAIGTSAATPEVQANVLHLCILNRRQGKVPLGCPGNHASQHALCEWQEEGVTRRALCEWTSCEPDRLWSLLYSSPAPTCIPVHPSCFHILKTLLLSLLLILLLLQTIVYAFNSAQLLCASRMERLTDKLIILFQPMVKFLFPGKKDYSGNIILLLRGMSWISGCHDWLQQWQPVFISLPSVLAHARRSKSESSLEKTCTSLSMCDQTTGLLSPLNKCKT